MPYETDPKHIDFVLTADNYLIYDSDRLGPNSLKDLYKGRDVIVDLSTLTSPPPRLTSGASE